LSLTIALDVAGYSSPEECPDRSAAFLIRNQKKPLGLLQRATKDRQALVNRRRAVPLDESVANP